MPAAEVPFELRYQLSRRQRLVLHLRIWGVVYTPFVVVVFTFFCVQTIVNACSLTWAGVAVFGGLALGVFILLRGLFVGLLDVLLVPDPVVRACRGAQRSASRAASAPRGSTPSRSS